MFFIDDLPTYCPSCGAELHPDQICEDFYAGAVLSCPDCGEFFRYLPKTETPDQERDSAI